LIAENKAWYEIGEETAMARPEVTPEQLIELLGGLQPDELKMVLAKLADRLEVQEWMRLGECGLREWLNEPDLYADDRQTR
jgi:hypothetical protein